MHEDAIGLIEAAYDVGKTTQAWIDGVADAAARLDTSNRGLVVALWQLKPGQHPATHFTARGLENMDPGMLAAFQAEHGEVPEEMLRAMYLEMPSVELASRIPGHPFNHPKSVRSLDEAVTRLALRDLVGINARVDGRHGLLMSFPLAGDNRFGKREERMWTRLAVHLGAGLRLHERVRSAAPEPDAVLSPRGRLLHAEGDAAAKPCREELAAAAKTVDRARGRLRRVDEHGAVELWRALVRGEWSLVDRFDTDGKRFVIAHKNAPRERISERRLSLREAQAATLLARGYSNKLIAYELGLALSTIANLLARAADKLGAATTLELVQIVRGIDQAL